MTTATTDPAAVDFFTDPNVGADPFAWYEQVRAIGPVWQEPHHGAFIVTGHAETVAVTTNPELFSSCIGVTGPFPGFPTEPGDDVRALVAERRDALPMSEHMVTMDPPMHTKHRALLMRLLTPRRLKENEAFVQQLAAPLLDQIVARGHAELFREYAQGFALTVVADLLGVPEEEHAQFRAQLGAHLPGALGDEPAATPTLNYLDDYFTRYIEDRRREPRADVLTSLATATFPDGSIPDVVDVVHVATFLFAAGQETSARLIVSSTKHLAENPDIQEQLRREPELIAEYIEELLRLESPVKSVFRLALQDTTLGGVSIPAGSIVAAVLAAANRDPERFELPAEFQLKRPDPYAQVAFGRGAHACPGGSLARLEGRVTLEQLLKRTKLISLSEEHHGKPGARRFNYDLTYILRGVQDLHVVFEAAA